MQMWHRISHDCDITCDIGLYWGALQQGIISYAQQSIAYASGDNGTTYTIIGYGLRLRLVAKRLKGEGYGKSREKCLWNSTPTCRLADVNAVNECHFCRNVDSFAVIFSMTLFAKHVPQRKGFYYTIITIYELHIFIKISVLILKTPVKLRLNLKTKKKKNVEKVFNLNSLPNRSIE